MSIKVGSIIVVIVAMFLAKISVDNVNSAQAREIATNNIQTR